MNLIPPDNREVILSGDPRFNQFPLTAVTAIDSQSTPTPSRRANRGSGIVIAPNHVLTAGHVSYSVALNNERHHLRATISANEISLNSPILGTPGDPAHNIVERYYPDDFPAKQAIRTDRNPLYRSDIALLKTEDTNTLLSESQTVGLIAFVNLRSAIGLEIETAGYPSDNVSNNILNN